MQLHFYLLLNWIYTQQKLLKCLTVQHSDVNRIQRGVESFFDFLQTVVKQLIHNCRRAGWKPTRYARLCSSHFKESSFEVDIFSSTNGSISFKMSATEKASTQRKLSIMTRELSNRNARRLVNYE